MKIGLKLWSSNAPQYLEAAKSLYKQGVFDYIELYVVPGTLGSISLWKESGAPYVLHAPHFMHGMNLAQKEKEASNRKLFEEVFAYCEGLEADYIIAHGGMGGSIAETARQIKSICADYIWEPDQIALENKPFWVSYKEEVLHCRGFSPEEIAYVKEECGVSFCLDAGHAACSASSQGLEHYTYIEEFQKLRPLFVHLSDEVLGREKDSHLHIGAGNFDFPRLLKILGKDITAAIETEKDSPNNLDDFAQDASLLKSFL